MSKVTSLHHIVFCTKGRQMTLPLVYCDDLYRFIWKEITTKKCHLHRIGGIQNHVHMLIDLNPTVALSELMQAIKGHSSAWLRKDTRFPYFNGWAHEYFAASISVDNKVSVIEYIKSQREHHLGRTFDDEIVWLYRKAGQAYDSRDLM